MDIGIVLAVGSGSTGKEPKKTLIMQNTFTVGVLHQCVGSQKCSTVLLSLSEW